MGEKIEIGVNARLNTAGIERDAKRIDKTLESVGKRKIDPVSDAAVKKAERLGRGVDGIKGAGIAAGRQKIDPIPDVAIKKAEALFQAYLKIDREMARRLKVTNQQGLGPDQIDWNPVYQNEKSRRAKLAQLQSFMRHGGEDFAPPGQGGGGGGGGGIKGMAAGAAQAGMRAAGPVGGVAANALGTGMASGFGAGMMGLFGGIAALGVGKLVRSITEKIDQAENNNIAYDRLKRTLGDVNVSFEGLKSAVMRTGEGLNITYDESAQLASKFAKLGNVSGAEYRDLPGELGVGVGLSKAYGLDPDQGVGFMGQLRGVGVTKDTQDSRRMAILIGETIAKSGAFAKADEVMDAIAGYATSQTRASMAVANVSGYAGMLSSMAGSGIPGMDVQGSAAILSRMNSALSAGGARGEASQFFTSIVGNRMGLDPLQTQVLREGGMFASKDQMFGMAENGKPSAYQRYMGQTGPTGSSTFLEETRKLIEEKYAGDSETQKLMRAQAFGNHTGLGMNQAMAVLSMKPNEMGALQKVLGPNGLNGVNASGINNAAMALNGTDEDRASIAASLKAREDLKKEDRDKLDGLGAMSAQDQKEVLAKMSAQYEQERTTGTDIRDSRAALDNIKTKIADYVVPTLVDMRRLMIRQIGGDKLTPDQVMKKIEEGESKDRKTRINSEYDSKKAEFSKRRAALEAENAELVSGYKAGVYTPEQFKEKSKDIASRMDDLSAEAEAAKTTRDDRLKAENSPKVGSGAGGQAAGKTITGNAGFEDDAKAENLTAEERKLALSIYAQESGGGKNTGTSHAGATGHMQMLPSTFEAFADKDWDINNPTHNRRAGMRYLKHLLKKSGGNVRSAAGGYYGGEGAIRSDGSLRTFKDRKNPNFPDTQQYADEVMGRMSRIPDAPSAGTPLPSGGAGPGRGSAESYNQLRVSAEPMSITVNHKDSWGREVRPPETIQTRINAPEPNTYNHR